MSKPRLSHFHTTLQTLSDIDHSVPGSSEIDFIRKNDRKDMRRSRIYMVVLLVAVLANLGKTQAQSISINLDKKVIYTDSLNMPRQTSISMVLMTMSELLQRPTETFYSNYDIKVNDISVSHASDVALSQLDIQDVERVEITESPTSSYQKNGQGGSINLVLRKKDNTKRDLWGSASAKLAYPTNLSPQLQLGRQSEKLYITAMALSDIYRNNSTSESIVFHNDLMQNRTTIKRKEDYRSQLINFQMEYKPTNKNLLRINLSESYLHEDNTSTPDYVSSNASTDHGKTSNLNAVAQYEHTFGRAKLIAETNYTYKPANNSNTLASVVSNDRRQNQHIAAGKVGLNCSVLKPSTPHKLTLGAGNNYNFTFQHENIDFEDLRTQTAGYKGHLAPVNNTDFMQPYVLAEATVGQFRMKVQGEFQHYRYKLSNNDMDFNAISNDFTGQFITEWHFARNRALRLLGMRALQRPSEQQLFPFRLFSPTSMGYVEGNSELIPIMTHEIRLDMIADEHWNEHKLHYDVNVSYKKVNDMIETVERGGTTGGGGLGMTQQYQTFINNGQNDIMSANLMAMYSYHSFAVTLTSNLFHNKQQMGDATDHYTYYNLSLSPHFNLKDGWQGDFALTYNSRVKTSHSTLSDCTQITTVIGKRWKDLYIYGFSSMALQKHARNITWTGNQRTDYLHEMVPNSAGLCVKYLF